MSGLYKALKPLGDTLSYALIVCPPWFVPTRSLCGLRGFATRIGTVLNVPILTAEQCVQAHGVLGLVGASCEAAGWPLQQQQQPMTTPGAAQHTTGSTQTHTMDPGCTYIRLLPNTPH